MDFVKMAFKFVLGRLVEPSTWAGIAAGMFGWGQELIGSFSTAASGVAVFLAIFLKEKKVI